MTDCSIAVTLPVTQSPPRVSPYYAPQPRYWQREGDFLPACQELLRSPAGAMPPVRGAAGIGAGSRGTNWKTRLGTNYDRRITHLEPGQMHHDSRTDPTRPGSRTQHPWKKWGPYLSERQWGTVREDYSEGGDAWNYFTHDQARSRAYRWGEDGLAGISDDKQRLCFALALWNGKDPILKERLFGLTNSESNHGEDVKEYYFYLDSTPTHSYMKYLYKYPQAAFPYADLVETSRRRGRQRDGV